MRIFLEADYEWHDSKKYEKIRDSGSQSPQGVLGVSVVIV